MPVAILLSMAMLLAACGSGSGSSSPNDTTANGMYTSVTLASSGTPHTGGSLTYALEAESDGFNPTQNRWAVSGTMVALAVFDPLVALDANSQPQPYLAQSLTPNADYTRWTVKLRPGIQFSDGTPLTAAAVVKVMNAHKASALTSPALAPLQSMETPDDLTVVFVMSSPWVAFPASLTGQMGVIPAPSMLDDPQGSSHPIGTGPFIQKSWVPDKEWVGTKNPNYWRKDSNGTRLPYLDQVTFQPIPDNQARLRAIESGEVQMMHTTDPGTINTLKDDASAGRLQLVEDQGETEEGFIMLNLSAPPFDDLNARLAVASAVDRNAYTQIVDMGVDQPATGPFTPGSPWNANVPFPGHDVNMAKQYAQKYSDAHGGQPLSFTLSSTPPTGAVNGPELLQQQLKEAGIDVTLQSQVQSTLIGNVVTGKYQAVVWRQFGSPDPDYDHLWWDPANGKGAITLNMARNTDPALTDILKRARESSSVDARKAAYADLQKEFATQIPYVWLDHVRWYVAAANNVRGITNGPLPDGEASLPMGGVNGYGSATRLTMTWVTQ